MKPVVIESPFKASELATEAEHVVYAQRAMLDCLRRKESPFASHLLYTQVLDDAAPADRDQGIEAGFVWARLATTRVFYVDYGLSSSMELGQREAVRLAQDIEFRRIGRAPAPDTEQDSFIRLAEAE